jgi:hypothetical protein
VGKWVTKLLSVAAAVVVAGEMVVVAGETKGAMQAMGAMGVERVMAVMAVAPSQVGTAPLCSQRLAGPR